MGEAKRNKARLGDWYSKAIVPGHPDFPKLKQSMPMPIAAQHLTVPQRIEHETTNAQTREDAPQGTPVASEYITNVDPAIPGSDRTVVAAYRPNQSPAYRRVNQRSALMTMAILGATLGMIGSVPYLAETIGEPDDKKDKS